MMVFTVYDHPRDYPNHFVVRGWEIDNLEPRPRQECTLASTLDEARKAIPKGFINIGRFEDDDSVILEVWI